MIVFLVGVGSKTVRAMYASSLPLAFFSKKVYKQFQKIFLPRKVRCYEEDTQESIRWFDGSRAKIF